MSLPLEEFLAALGTHQAASFRQPAHQVDYLPGGRQLVVSFEPVQTAPPEPLSRPVWGQEFLLRRGYSVLGVKRQVSDWYRWPPLHQLFRALQSIGWFRQFDKVVFYGPSMGGYAALAFAECAPGSIVLALGPQSTLAPDRVWFDQRFAGARASAWAGDFVDGADGAAAASRVYVCYDPFQVKDRLHVARLQQGNLVRLRLPFTGHATALALRAMNLLGPVFDGAVAGTLTEAGFRALARARVNWADYHARLAERGRYRPRRLAFIARALERDPTNERALMLREWLKPLGRSGAPTRWPAGVMTADRVPMVYLDIPKSASTTIQNHLYFLSRGVPAPNPGRIWNQAGLLRGSDERDNIHELIGRRIAAPRVVIFSFVRHPASRAYACFRERIMLNHRREYDNIRTALREQWGVRWPEPNEAASLSAERENFERFLAFVEANLAGRTNLRRDPAWQAQSLLLRIYRRHVSEPFIGKVESFEADFAELLHRADVRRVPDLSVRPWRCPLSPFALADVLTPTSRDALQRLYAADYQELGYEPAP